MRLATDERRLHAAEQRHGTSAAALQRTCAARRPAACRQRSRVRRRSSSSMQQAPEVLRGILAISIVLQAVGAAASPRRRWDSTALRLGLRLMAPRGGRIAAPWTWPWSLRSAVVALSAAGHAGLWSHSAPPACVTGAAPLGHVAPAPPARALLYGGGTASLAAVGPREQDHRASCSGHAQPAAVVYLFRAMPMHGGAQRMPAHP